MHRIATLDEVIDGFEGGQLVIVAARPGQGKTALACNIAAANALSDVYAMGGTPIMALALVAIGGIISYAIAHRAAILAHQVARAAPEQIAAVADVFQRQAQHFAGRVADEVADQLRGRGELLNRGLDADGGRGRRRGLVSGLLGLRGFLLHPVELAALGNRVVLGCPWHRSTPGRGGIAAGKHAAGRWARRA